MKKLREFTKSKMINKLWHAITLLEGDREVRQFLEDILYPSEVSMLGQRLLIATLIRQGFTYEQIIKTTGAGADTINRVLKVFRGGTAGYELVLSRLSEEREKEVYRRKEYNKSPEQRYLERRIRRGK
jgi:TrpR-related protein YerC/YecD